jgi:EAL domain-containing protein (putative c-di-GMP-specific phosphodiesterase class I)
MQFQPGNEMISSYTLQDIILEEKIVTFFQPIVSIKKKNIIGYESLSRGLDKEGKIVSPREMFNLARQTGLNLNLDRLCRKKAVETFSSHSYFDENLLFVNFDTAILDNGVLGSGWIEKLVKRLGVDPSSVAIEIVESDVISHEALTEFVKIHKSLGFLIVLDDFGAERSNFDRIFQLKPDIIKIDRQLVCNISNDFYKESIVGSIINLAGKIGALTLAEGVETLDEIVKCHELGADLFQGYYLSKPDILQSIFTENIKDKIDIISTKITGYMDIRISMQVKKQNAYDKIIKKMLYGLSYLKDEEYDSFLIKCIEHYSEIECAYVIDDKGIQIGDTIMRKSCNCKHKHHLFSPAEIGTDHSLKTYYFYIKHLKLDKYFTDPYISMATGNLCRTMSAVLKNTNNINRILCTDFTI